MFFRNPQLYCHSTPTERFRSIARVLLPPGICNVCASAGADSLLLGPSFFFLPPPFTSAFSSSVQYFLIIAHSSGVYSGGLVVFINLKPSFPTGYGGLPALSILTSLPSSLMYVTPSPGSPADTCGRSGFVISSSPLACPSLFPFDELGLASSSST